MTSYFLSYTPWRRWRVDEVDDLTSIKEAASNEVSVDIHELAASLHTAVDRSEAVASLKKAIGSALKCEIELLTNALNDLERFDG